MLQEFLEQHAEDVERIAREEMHTTRRRGGRIASLVVLVVVFAIVWWKGDAWLGPAVSARPTAAQVDAALRVSLYLQAQRIKSFELRTGHLPDRLDDAGPPLPGIRYEKLDGRTYLLIGHNRDITLSYRSDQPVRELLGQSASRLGL